MQRNYIGNPTSPRGAFWAAFQTVLRAGRKSDLEGRQGASAKRANGDFPSRGWKIVIGQFDYRGRIIGHTSHTAFQRAVDVL